MGTYKAVTDVSVAGELVEAGDTFEADEEQMTDAVVRGLVEEVKEAPKPRGKRTTGSS